MSIEVKQMLVKSTVLQTLLQEEGTRSDTRNRDLPQDLTAMKEDILNECRRMIIDVLREQQER